MKRVWMLWMMVAVTAVTTAGQPLSPKVTLRVYDLAGMSASDLAEALCETAHIFGAAGLDLSWMVADPITPEAHLLDESVFSMPTAPPHLVVARIVSKSGLGIPTEVLGRALPFASAGAQITIFLDHIRIRQEDVGVAVPNLLGYALAHELGHVLLRSGVHAPVGLMRSEWGRTEFQRIIHGALRFSRAEAAALRAAFQTQSDPLCIDASEGEIKK